jgi:hypothetical protein
VGQLRGEHPPVTELPPVRPDQQVAGRQDQQEPGAHHGTASNASGTNDGVADGGPTTAGGPDGRGHGLTGLAERLATVGGSLTVRRTEDVFTVEATVPVAAA